MQTLGKLTFGILCGFFYVFVAWRLWGWFAVPLGAPVLGYAHAFGLYTLCSSILLWSLWAGEVKDKSHYTNLAVAKFVGAGMVLLEGYIAHLFLVAA